MRRRSSKSVTTLLKTGGQKSDAESEPSSEIKLDMKNEPVSGDETATNQNIDIQSSEDKEDKQKEDQEHKEDLNKETEAASKELDANFSDKEPIKTRSARATRRSSLAEKKPLSSIEDNKRDSIVDTLDEANAKHMDLVKESEEKSDNEKKDDIDAENEDESEERSNSLSSLNYSSKRGPGRPKKSSGKIIDEKQSEHIEPLDSESLDKRSLNLKGRLVRHKQSQPDYETDSDSQETPKKDTEDKLAPKMTEAVKTSGSKRQLASAEKMRPSEPARRSMAEKRSKQVDTEVQIFKIS